MHKSLVFIAFAMLMAFSSCKDKPGQLTLITDANDIYADVEGQSFAATSGGFPGQVNIGNVKETRNINICH